MFHAAQKDLITMKKQPFEGLKFEKFYYYLQKWFCYKSYGYKNLLYFKEVNDNLIVVLAVLKCNAHVLSWFLLYFRDCNRETQVNEL